jgi:hypothetical protein
MFKIKHQNQRDKYYSEWNVMLCICISEHRTFPINMYNFVSLYVILKLNLNNM